MKLNKKHALTRQRGRRMTQKNVFSVLILMYNNGQYLYDAIDSVLQQNYPSIEIIIADDKSKEFDRDKIQKYIVQNKSDNIKRYLIYQNQENLGTVKNINRALKEAGGSYIKLLAADDALYDKHVLTNAVTAFQTQKHLIITSRVMKCDGRLFPIKYFDNRFQEKLSQLTPFECYKELCIHNRIVAGGVFFSKRFFEKYGFFDENYKLLEDWPKWLSVTRQGCFIGYSKFTGAKYRSNVGCATSTNKIYLADKRRVFKNEIQPYSASLGAGWVMKAKIVLLIRNSLIIRKIYALFSRK